MTATTPQFTYTAVRGYFEQDEPTANPDPVDAVTLPGLGLIQRLYEGDDGSDRKEGDWEAFARHLDHLNRTGGDKVRYKLIYATRHGEGYHNVKEAEVGKEAWESYWARLDGDGKTVWADADLTPKGRAQALAMNAFWQESAAKLKLPLPRRHYASPHSRCLDTCQLAFTGIALPEGQPPAFQPIVKELIRERMGIHTCDRRRTRTWIAESHPGFVIEEGFAERDELWKPDIRETLPEHAVRVRAFLGELFANDSEAIVSLTIHSGTLIALFSVVGHPELNVAPGNVVPLLIKAQL
ncbi:histidine phosphatase superfamily [Lasiosphaeris hirsuta]|uniref:Histidine phosphatase superfamily n=1 Tax=Lasiosphaeris hirsuta TaxID=260670 RepID=A0AA40DJB1_9PEZI|nr:histidine phosphatase superfamily [Lasiosphaeris hirsuta]